MECLCHTTYIISISTNPQGPCHSGRSTVSPYVVTGVTFHAEPAHVAGGRYVIGFLEYDMNGRVIQFTAVLETSEVLREASPGEFTTSQQEVHLGARALPY